ncbi:MAG: endolytic transglycosylase MltG [Candidatus Yonathbacteria bacterium CG_4_10_14_3_um_filter_47_65]|uniref:Endolytic murein transglycosylase n=2 Tax=Parcubacteria group TaxID=1794811 RepID=A0A2M8D5T0_9BACT|nr:MAG: hypothetical protein AUJ44_02025 [Candidatus Nomurabacteria bacterium CG1_02_47_685]PIP03251.1 MAG: hypothetical protein COX54_04390 [Candidatus Yonathbacteria bacterium CG23_combo_of_CG06-09_8_20_14_all_46_18]PIQ32139.1 MAG: hypothetical protein COW61_02270 [Candidatus Yonathbacteria bacterium CG17_big_fil_post_rev_8_21_14_2_50_46_19]PIX56444.1 MAG: endolytic transglycosylase MltG [Candidatus Yonathbacteria bacterium CG_4_10_14_3_um_filter_47_65]PIY57732.1 MAG: endolytic transglycosyla
MIDLPPYYKQWFKKVRTVSRSIFRCFKGLRLAREGVLIFLLTVFVVGYIMLVPPVDFPTGRMVRIEEGMTLTRISELLKDDHVIRSRALFEFFTIAIAGDKKVIAGDYYFGSSSSLFDIAQRLTAGTYGLSPKKIRVPEGVTVVDMAKLFSSSFSDITEDDFLAAAEGKEGYLFPDTYFFLSNVKADQVVKEMERNFNIKMTNIQSDINDAKKQLNEIITMASILEKEAGNFESKEIISGILWKRIEIGMPLQVDATFLYINGKSTYDLTLDDLAIDSPYNTYKYKGLPSGPISNPGLDSIEAALHPQSTPYLYYLSDRSGNLYYSRDFEEHKENKHLHLN